MRDARFHEMCEHVAADRIEIECLRVSFELKRPELAVRPDERHSAVDEHAEPAEARLIRKLRVGGRDGYFE